MCGFLKAVCLCISNRPYFWIMLKVENLTSQLQEHIFSCVTEDNLVMIVTLTIAAFFFFFSLVTVCFCSVRFLLFLRTDICQNKCMWVIKAKRNVCWTTGNFLCRKRSWELPVEQSIVGLLAEVPLPQLQLTRRGWKIVLPFAGM